MTNPALRQLLVAFKTLPSKEERELLWKKYGVKEVEQVGKNALILVQAPLETSEADFVALRKELGQAKDVRYAEPNIQMKIFKGSGQ